jgi:type VI secretion system protein ImpK
MTTAMPQAEPHATGSRPGELALALQEAFTVAVRLRANRQVAADAASFRSHVKKLLASADRDARGQGYSADTVRLAIYAYIAFLDETVLNSSQPMFSQWARQPLQEEVFGEHMAGENFFRYVGDLLGRQDSAELGDLLEVYQLCMLLGFRGKYSSDPGSLQGLNLSVQQKMARIRGTRSGFPSAWVLPSGEVVQPSADPWVRRLARIAVSTTAIAFLLFVVFKVLLTLNANGIRELATSLLGGAS